MKPAVAHVPEWLGDYRIVREIGRGGMGVVYEAEQGSLGRHVALKLLPEHLLRNEDTKRRFHREARAAARLHHTNIVPVFGVGEADGTSYYAMQFIDGLPLNDLIEELKSQKKAEERDTDEPAENETKRSLLSAASLARSMQQGAFAATDEWSADADGQLAATLTVSSAPLVQQPS